MPPISEALILERSGTCRGRRRSGPDVPESHQLAPRLVPQGEPRAGEALGEAETPGALEGRDGVEGGAQAVVRDLDGEMVDVMEPDPAGEPVQKIRQVVQGAALEGRGLEIPLAAALPVGVGELMLDVEEPDAD